MDPGELNQRITIEELTTTYDDGGGYSQTWTTFATVWAKIRGITGNERYTAQQIEAVTDYVVKIRYRPGVKATMRIKHGDKVLDIIAAFDPEGKRREMTLLCEEEKTNGG
jgi:SPP1 family predicted phage head-tail adaptor